MRKELIIKTEAQYLIRGDRVLSEVHGKFFHIKEARILKGKVNLKTHCGLDLVENLNTMIPVVQLPIC